MTLLGADRLRRTRDVRRAPVMGDVARLAGVSHQTVSRVLNDSPSVREQTRRRVLDAITTLGYRPNRIARALATNGFRSLGLVTTDTLAHGPASTLLGIERAARDVGWGLAIAAPTGLTAAAMGDAIDALLDQGVGGLLVIAPQDGVVSALPAHPGDRPIIWVAGPGSDELPASRHPTVRVDQAAGARLATEHLLGLGHRTVWHVAGPLDWHEARARRGAWAAALGAAGAPVPPVLVGTWAADSGYAAGRELARRDDVTAVFAANDETAFGVLRALHEAGRRVPADVSIVGFDDLPVSGYTIPPLTTIRQDFDELGRRAVAGLGALVAPGVGQPADTPLTPRLVVRASTAPPRR